MNLGTRKSSSNVSSVLLLFTHCHERYNFNSLHGLKIVLYLTRDTSSASAHHLMVVNNITEIVCSSASDNTVLYQPKSPQLQLRGTVSDGLVNICSSSFVQ